MWKFDVSDKDPKKWKVAFTSNNQPAPLFTAIYTPFSVPDPSDPSKTLTSGSGPQPITAKPEFSQHPDGGNMVYFGTGKYFLEGDHILLKETDPVETFYGIWDECVNYAGGAGNCANVPISGGKSQLVKQTIDFEGVFVANEKDSFNVEVTSKNEVDFSKDKGWYMELYKGSGYFTAEKVISQAIILNGRVIFATILPDARGFCTFGGTSSLRLLDALTGKSPDLSAFDLTGDGKFNTDDQITINVNGVDTQFSISGIKSKVGMIDSPAVVDTDGAKIKLVTSGSSGETEEYTIAKPGGGRLSWLQIR
jgi:type IV pilus assembly protein PilY1